LATTRDLETLAINTIRTLSIDAVEKANSGHPGLPMGAAPMAYTLWMHFLRHNPQNPKWANRDRFVLSAGHGSMLLYSLLHLTGYDLPLEDIKNFRQWDSITAGHPEYHLTPGVETTTGPLGQGAATAVGMALAESYLAKHFNREGHNVVDHHTYALVSDGDLMEGVSMEACALAGHWGLHKLIFLYDANEVTLDGPASMIFSENIRVRFDAWSWNVLHVYDGNDTTSIAGAIETARAQTERPTIIIINTTIGYGSPNKAGTSKAHGSPLGTDEVRATKEFYGWPQEPFYIPGEALEHFRSSVERGAEYEAEWQQTFEAWKAAYPELANEWDNAFSNRLPDGWDTDIPTFSTDKEIATRNASGDVLNAIAKHIPTMIGGDADLAGSTKTLIKGANNTGKGVSAERNVRFGVREHGMGAIVNGLAVHGGIIRPYSATFLTFSDYMRPAVRIGALMSVPSLYIFTHDSIGLGEDGPTHQPIEHVMSLRAIPQLYVFRPADANETAGAWHTAMMLGDYPAALIFTRQELPVFDNAERIHEGVAHGGYILADCDGTPAVILLSSGSEVHIAMDAYKQLMNEGIKTRLVSLPCWELFDEQDDTYKESVLPKGVTNRVSIEAGVTLGWQKFVGTQGIAIGIDRFGASAPYQRIYEEYGLTPKHVVDAAKSLVGQSQQA
jgi:transketolase